MRKKSLLLVSPVLLAGVISSCGGNGWNKVTTDEAIKVANYYDTRLSDVVMKDSNARFHINTFGVKNGTGLFSYQKLDESGSGKVAGVDLTNLSFTAGEQDVAGVLIPNMILNDANTAMKKTIGEDKPETFASIGYALSATISAEMIKYYTGSLKELYGVTEWQHMKTNLYSKKSSNGNDILQAEINIDSFTGLRDEMAAAKIPEVDSVFKILGDGTMNITATCDDFGYVSHLGIKVKSDANKKLTYKTGTQAASGGGSLPAISDIINGKIKPVGIDFEGEADIDFSIDITHNQAEEYGVAFQKSLYTIKDDTATHVSTDTIVDVTKDATLDINPYAPIKIDTVRSSDVYPNGIPIYGPTASAFEGNGYAVKINLKKGEKETDWVLGKDYMYMGYDNKQTDLEKQCFSLLKWYNVDKVGIVPENDEEIDEWGDDAKAYPYASLIVNGIRVPTKTPKDASSLFGSDYCYFTVEMPTEYPVGQTPKATDLYLVLHVGKDIITKAKATLGGAPKLTVDLKLQKLK